MSPSGRTRRGSVGPQITSRGLPAAAATCAVPVSLATISVERHDVSDTGLAAEVERDVAGLLGNRGAFVALIRPADDHDPRDAALGEAPRQCGVVARPPTLEKTGRLAARQKHRERRVEQFVMTEQ